MTVRKPAFSAVTVYVPGIRSSIRYWPEAPLSTVREKPVASWRAVTDTPATVADDWSETTPNRLLDATWEDAAVAAQMMNATRRSISLDATILPCH